MLRYGEPGQAHAKTVTRRFVHLAKDHRHLVQHTGFFHLVIEIIPFTGALTHTGKNRQARMLFGDVVDQLHDRHRFAHASTAKQSDLAAFGDRHDQIDDLDAGFKNLDAERLVGKTRGLAVDGQNMG